MDTWKNTVKVCFAISGIVALEIFALSQGIDGAIYAVVIAALAGLGGYQLRKVKEE